MNEISGKNRKDANETVKKDLRYSQILSIMKSTSCPLTAREIETEMVAKDYVSEFNLNDVRPRLTELSQLHKVKVYGRQIDTVSGKSNSTYVIDEDSWKYVDNHDQIQLALWRNYGK